VPRLLCDAFCCSTRVKGSSCCFAANTAWMMCEVPPALPIPEALAKDMPPAILSPRHSSLPAASWQQQLYERELWGQLSYSSALKHSSRCPSCKPEPQSGVLSGRSHASNIILSQAMDCDEWLPSLGKTLGWYSSSLEAQVTNQGVKHRGKSCATASLCA
jgi:hypothetical protein